MVVEVEPEPYLGLPVSQAVHRVQDAANNEHVPDLLVIERHVPRVLDRQRGRVELDHDRRVVPPEPVDDPHPVLVDVEVKVGVLRVVKLQLVELGLRYRQRCQVSVVEVVPD